MSHLQPVGKVISGYSGDPDSRNRVLAVLNTAGEALKVGTDLYTHPSKERMALEVSVANDNAAHHKAALEKANKANHWLRKRVREQRALLNTIRDNAPSLAISDQITQLFRKQADERGEEDA